jgi:hypothetical protein
VKDVGDSSNHKYEGRHEDIGASQFCATKDTGPSKLRADTVACATQNSVTCVSRHQSTLGLLQHLATIHRNDDELRTKVLGIAHDWIWQSEMDAWGSEHE